ncbi:MAG: hypothetical protein CO114_00795, partial [Euryarchaeota archaeon CG_4_9_14_3_um_filter_38_12]
TYSIGNLAVIDKANAQLGGYFEQVFGKIAGKAHDFVPMVKLFMYNRLGDCFATNRLTSYPMELFSMLGFKSLPKERSLYRMIERVGKQYAFVLEEHQKIIKRHNLVTMEQFMDFSSSYFEGRADALGELGYSRDNQPGKKQITFGISTGINNIPTALTIQKGNVQDKEHFQFMLRTAEAVLEEGSLLITDCGANSKSNKELIRGKRFHYLTFKGKKVGPYKEAIRVFHAGQKHIFVMNDRKYECVKRTYNDETQYIFFSEDLKREQFARKEKRFQKELERNQPLLKKTKTGKPLSEYYSSEGIIVAKGILQKIIDDLGNPHIKWCLRDSSSLKAVLIRNPSLFLHSTKIRTKPKNLFVTSRKELNLDRCGIGVNGQSWDMSCLFSSQIS